MALAIKVGSIGCSLVLVPMTIDFVNATQYGIWLTISSVVMWMQFFDVGFSNGLRNKLAEALAQGDTTRAQSYVSTTYAMLSAIFGTLMLVLLALIWWLPVTPLFNLDVSYEPSLKQAASILVIYFCISFVTRTLNFVLMAKQRSAMSSLMDFIGQVGVLAVVWCLKGQVEGSLPILALALSVPPLAVWLILSLWIYGSKYRDIRPRLRCVHLSDVNVLLNLGVKFFVIGIAFIIQFQSSTFLIARLFSVEQVTTYNIAYKYFNVLYMVSFLLIEPLWSAITDAWTRGDREWIAHAIRKYTLITAALSVGGIVMLILSPWVYDIWLNRHIQEPLDIPFDLSMWVLLYNIVLMLGQVYCTFVNGIGALRIQFCTSLISPLVFVGAALLLTQVFGMGVSSILIASIIANFNGLILAPLQYYQVIHRQRQGIWTQ